MDIVACTPCTVQYIIYSCTLCNRWTVYTMNLACVLLARGEAADWYVYRQTRGQSPYPLDPPEGPPAPDPLLYMLYRLQAKNKHARLIPSSTHKVKANFVCVCKIFILPASCPCRGIIYLKILRGHGSQGLLIKNTKYVAGLWHIHSSLVLNGTWFYHLENPLDTITYV